MSEAMDNTHEEDLIGEQQIKTAEELAAAVKSFNERPEPVAEEVSAKATPEVELVPRKRTPAEMVELEIAKQKFEKALPERSFSGRNPELGPMIKCAQCGLRHRDNVKHDPIKYKKDTTQSEHGRPVANAAGWRAKPGKLMWIKELKKFVTLTR
jgi:hypothetical protein